MTWLVAASQWMRCGRGGSMIGVGEPYALVSAVTLKRCLECMRVAFNVDPPPEVWAKVPPTDAMPESMKSLLQRVGVS